MADVGLLAVYWTDPDEGGVLLTSPTAQPGFLRRREVLDAYADASGRDISHVDYYIALGFWKLACIVEGVYARYAGGSMGSDGGPNGFEGFKHQVEHCARQAAAAVERLG
jgi:aminoglycoside phosphotransferase (APT) family kinase protein